MLFKLRDRLYLPYTPPATYASQANTGYGSQFLLGDASSPINYTAVAEIKTYSVDGFSLPEIISSHLLSPDNTEELVPGMKKPGKVSFTANLIGDASQLQIETLAAARTTFPFKVIAPVQRLTKTYTLIGTAFFTSKKLGPFETGRPIELAGDIQMAGAYTETVA